MQSIVKRLRSHICWQAVRNMHWHRFWPNPSSPRGWSGWFRCYSLANSLKKFHDMLTSARYVGMQHAAIQTCHNSWSMPKYWNAYALSDLVCANHLVRVLDCNSKNIRRSSWNIPCVGLLGISDMRSFYVGCDVYLGVFQCSLYIIHMIYHKYDINLCAEKL